MTARWGVQPASQVYSVLGFVYDLRPTTLFRPLKQSKNANTSIRLHCIASTNQVQNNNRPALKRLGIVLWDGVG